MTNYEAFNTLFTTRTVLHTTCNIKPCTIVNITRRVIKRGVFLLQPSHSSPLEFIVSAHILKCSPPSPPPPILFVQTLHLKSKSTILVNTTSQLISSHYPSSHPCRSSNSSPPSGPPHPPFLFPAQFVQTPHLPSKSARVINTCNMLISRHYFSSHP